MTRFLLNLAVNVALSVVVAGVWVLLFDVDPVTQFWWCMVGAYAADIVGALLRSPR